MKSIKQASEQIPQGMGYNWESLIGFLDLFIISRCNFVVVTCTSNFGRLIYEFMHIDDPNPFKRFKSLDINFGVHGYPREVLNSKTYEL